MKISTQIVTRSAVILALAMAVQLVKLPQPITGPVVNALLFIAAALIGPISALLIGLCTPVIAFAFGIMPFAPAVVIIMLGNGILALTFGFLAKRPIMAYVGAALAKFIVMSALVMYIVPSLFGIKVPAKIVAALTTPQLLTALGGAVIAFIVLKGIERITNSSNSAEL